MIRSKDVNQELKILEEVVDNPKASSEEVNKGILKSNILLTKVLRDVRSNMVRVMEHLNIPLQKNFRNSNEKEK